MIGVGDHHIGVTVAVYITEGRRKEIDSLYRALQALQPSPVVTLNRAVAIWKLEGPEAALEMIDPLKSELDAYFYFHGLRGTLLEELHRFAEARKHCTAPSRLRNPLPRPNSFAGSWIVSRSREGRDS